MGKVDVIIKFAFYLTLVCHVSDAPPTLDCDAGTYQSEDGSSCKKCPHETFMPRKNHTKKNCFDCTQIEDPTKEILIKPCDSLHDADIQCVEGYFRHRARNSRDISYCKKCKAACPENYTQVHPCQNFSDLGCCTGENYDYDVDENGIYFCRERPWMCRSGQFRDTQIKKCKPCPEGTFMHEDYHSYTQCWDCQYKSEADLPLHTSTMQPCNSTQPFRYSCKEGYYVNHGMSYRKDDIGCSPCQTCDEGKYVGRQCDSYHDTVCCDKPNMTVEDGPQGRRCVDRDSKDVGGGVDDSTIVILLLVLLLLVVLIIIVIYYKRSPGSRPKWLQRLVEAAGQNVQLNKRQTNEAEGGELEEMLIEETLQSKNQKLEADNTKLTEDINEKIRPMESVQIENATLQSKNQELEADKTKLTEDINEKLGEMESFRSENATLQSKIQELEADKTKLTEDIKEKTEEMESVRNENATLQSKNQELEADKTKLTEDINEKIRQMESVQIENATLQSKNQELEADKTKLTEDLNEKIIEMESVRSENGTLQSRIQELEAEKTRLTHELNMKKIELETTETKLIMESQNLKEKPDEMANHSGEEYQTSIRPSYRVRSTFTDHCSTHNETSMEGGRDLRWIYRSLKLGPNDQASAAEQLCKMARDERIRQNILSFPDLVPVLESLKESEHEYVRSKVIQALQMIKETTDLEVNPAHSM